MRNSVDDFEKIAKTAAEANNTHATKLMSIDERLTTLETRVDFLNAQTSAWKAR